MSYLHFYPASLADVLDCFSVSIPAIETTPLMDRLPLESGLLPVSSCTSLLSPLATLVSGDFSVNWIPRTKTHPCAERGWVFLRAFLALLQR